jgi:hypothetical protein
MEITLNIDDGLMKRLQDIAVRRHKTVQGLTLEISSRYTKRVQRIECRHVKVLKHDDDFLKYEYGEGYPELKLKHDTKRVRDSEANE